MGPQNAIMGNDYPTELPQSQVDAQEAQMADLQKKARFSKTAEFKELQAYITGRMEFYRTYLPGGEPVGTNGSPATSGKPELSMEEMGKRWVAANIIIGEFAQLLGVYETAADIVRETNATPKRK